MLDDLRDVMESINRLQAVRHRLVKRAVNAGAKWQEISFIDRTSAIRIYRDQEGCELKEAIEVVDEYLVSAARPPMPQ